MHFWSRTGWTTVCGAEEEPVTHIRTKITCEKCKKLLTNLNRGEIHFWQEFKNETTCGIGPNIPVLVTFKANEVTCVICRHYLGLDTVTNKTVIIG